MSDPLNLDDAIASKIEALLKERLGGFVEKLEAAAASLREALGEGGGIGKGKVKGKRGRPVGSGKGKGAKPGPKKKGGTRTRVLSADWQEAIRSILKAKGPLSRKDLTTAILKVDAFKDKTKGTAYNAVGAQADEMKDVMVSDGVYSLKGAAKGKAGKPAKKPKGKAKSAAKANEGEKKIAD